MFTYEASPNSAVTRDAMASFWLQRYCARVDVARSIMHNSGVPFPAAMEAAEGVMNQQFNQWLSQGKL